MWEALTNYTNTESDSVGPHTYGYPKISSPIKFFTLLHLSYVGRLKKDNEGELN
jgi:hypothetical protein